MHTEVMSPNAINWDTMRKELHTMVQDTHFRMSLDFKVSKSEAKFTNHRFTGYPFHVSVNDTYAFIAWFSVSAIETYASALTRLKLCLTPNYFFPFLFLICCSIQTMETKRNAGKRFRFVPFFAENSIRCLVLFLADRERKRPDEFISCDDCSNH